MSGDILILGGTGLLGRAMVSRLARLRRPFQAPGRAALDLTDPAAVVAAIEAMRPAAVFNLSGFTDVAAAERSENLRAVTALNAELPTALAAACARRRTPFVHVSTDYVFDGGKTTPYGERDPVNPLQIYGATKLLGEKGVIAADPGALIARVSTLYGPDRAHRPAYVDAILAQARAMDEAGGGELAVVERPVASPTYAPDVAPALLDLLDRRASGLVHVVNEGAASRLELASATVALAGFAGRVAVGIRPEPPNALSRPAYSVLDTRKLQTLIGRRLPAWDDALARYVRELGVRG